MTDEEVIDVSVDRDSVCAGDDCEPHRVSINVPATTTLGAFLQTLRDSHFLASIQGGEATWGIEYRSSGTTRSLGIVAQQWAIPRLLISPETLVADLMAGAEALLYFRYLSQSDPVEALAEIAFKVHHDRNL